MSVVWSVEVVGDLLFDPWFRLSRRVGSVSVLSHCAIGLIID